MDRKGQQVGLAVLVMAFIGIIIGLALYTGTFSENIGTLTQTRSTTNFSFTLPAAGATAELAQCGQKALAVVVTNRTSGVIVPSNNYTISQSAGTTGYLTAKITSTNGLFVSQQVNVSCSYEPNGYVADAGTRGIVGIIAVLMALCIVLAAVPDARNYVFDFFRR